MSTRIEVRAPADESEGTSSRVLRWLRTPGERVSRDEPLVELETDKVTVEVSAPADGVLSQVHKQDMDEVSPGDVLGTIESDAAAQDKSSADIPQGPLVATPLVPAPAQAVTVGVAASLLSPAVRRLLSEHGVSSAELSGSGSGGRITVDDVLRFVAARSSGGVAGSGDAGETEAGGKDGTGVRRLPHSAMRRRIAEHMVHSLLRTAPHVTTVFEADLGAVLAHRERHRAALADRGIQLTLSAYFIAACVDAIRDVPETNARWTDQVLELVDRIDIGVATAVADRGLVVPVIRDVAALDLAGIAARLAELTTRARDDRLTPADVRGGSFTISNHGVSGSLLAAPIVINQPQTAILGVGRLEKRPVVVEVEGQDLIVARPRCYVTLTIDHRVMDGHRANRFLSTFVRRLESWPPSGD